MYLCNINFGGSQNIFKYRIMATITLNYDARNIQAQKALEFILSLNLFQKRCVNAENKEYEQLKTAFLNGSKRSMSQQINKYVS